MARDWVPAHLYGLNVVVPPQAQVDIPLIDPDGWVDPDVVVGEVEYKQNYRLLRVIGQFFVGLDGSVLARNAIHIRLWNGLQDLGGAGSVFVPGVIAEDEVANEPFWWERTLGLSTLAVNDQYAQSDAFAHPWWTFMDRAFGKGKFIASNMVPTISVFNDEAAGGADLQFRHRIRMLVG